MQHWRRLGEDESATFDLFQLYYPVLVSRLRERNWGLSHDLLEQAAQSALVALFKRPTSFDPNRGRGGLSAFLGMAAQRDLQNLLRDEGRHHRGRLPWEGVEEFLESGNYPGEGEGAAERAAEARREVLALAVGLDWEPGEWRALELLLDGVRSDAVYVRECDLGQLPPEQQGPAAKNLKDTVKVRLKRAGGKRGRSA
jgi:DNA-directed RNA polymerase specialized sigma24 family protein